MSDTRGGARDGFADALLAARLCILDPSLGGIVLRGGGELRNAVIDAVQASLQQGAPVRRVPLNIDDDRLLGGMDLAATLASGVPVRQQGILAEAAGGIVLLPMAERISEATAGRIAAAIDAQEGSFLLLALDDGVEPEERLSEAILERVAFHLDLSEVRGASGTDAFPIDQEESSATIEVSPGVFETIAATAGALGVDSARASLFTLRAARALARLYGRAEVADEDVAVAARLVLAPRATRLPQDAPEPTAEEQEAQPPENDSEDRENGDLLPPEDIVLAAALAALPKDVLARIASGKGRRPSSRAGGAGERRRSPTRGRPLGARAGKPGGGVRLSLIDTLRSAAPWQKLRGRGDGRILVRRDDLRIRRFETRAEAVTIFAVDASGSSALARLAEAKGAVELLLAEAYVKRAQVALIAFRGEGAELLLPPTRSLTRARRALAELPGGGGTPLASGLDAARELAVTVRAKGRTPFLVILTDGRANIAADGRAVRATAEADAATAARAIGHAGIASAFVDISARPRPEGEALAAAMGARYLPLPRADSATMHAAVKAARPG